MAKKKPKEQSSNIKLPKYIGTPRKYETPDEMQEIIDEYFAECIENDIYPTVSMLAFRLDMSRKNLIEYEKCIELDHLKNCDDEMRKRFSNTVKKAKAYIEGGYENRLINDGRTPIGTIFTLKNNYNWVDKTEVEQTNKTIEVTLED